MVSRATRIDEPEDSLDCRGCGVCCFHMGYPAFILPQAPRTVDEIESDPRLREIARDPRTRRQLLDGIPGEHYWHILPEHLREELEQFVDRYEPPAEGELDGPCFWLDQETRLCKHHEHRPRVCRDFETGCKECHEWRDHYKSRIIQIGD